MSDQLSEEQLAEYRDAFTLFDKNEDGFIDKSELGVIMNSLGKKITEVELKDMISEVDSDNNGCIDFFEFLRLVSKVREDTRSNDDELIDTFKVFDKNNDGYINQDELRSVMSQLGEKLTAGELDEMIKEADTDGDGKINYVEFVKMMAVK